MSLTVCLLNSQPGNIPPPPLGVNGAASAAFGDIMFFGGVEGVNEGESTLNFPRPKLLQPRNMVSCLTSSFPSA